MAKGVTSHRTSYCRTSVRKISKKIFFFRIFRALIGAVVELPPSKLRCSRMWSDITIVAAIALCQLFVTVYAVWVSVTDHKLKIAFIIGVVGAIGVVLTVYAAIRAGSTQKSLQAQLDRIQHNTEQPQPPPVVNFNPQITVPPTPSPKQHTHVEYEPQVVTAGHGFPDLTMHLQPQLAPTVVFAFRNSGDFTVQRPSDAGLVLLVPNERANSVFKDHQKQLRFYGPGGSLTAHSVTGGYHTGQGVPLTADDVVKIKAGILALCGIGAIRWSDSTGKYETRFAQCLQSEPDHTGLNWHIMQEDNEEYRLN